MDYQTIRLTVAETDHRGHLSRITVVTIGTPSVIEQIKAQLGRIIMPHGIFTPRYQGRAISDDVLSSVMSFFMSEHAVAAMNFPIVYEIVTVLGLRPFRSSYAKALFIALAWGSTIGGVATLLGGGRAPLAMAILPAL